MIVLVSRFLVVKSIVTLPICMYYGSYVLFSSVHLLSADALRTGVSMLPGDARILQADVHSTQMN